MGRKRLLIRRPAQRWKNQKKPKEGMGDGGHLGDAMLDRVLIVLVETLEEAGVNQADQVLDLAHSPSKVARTRVVGSQTDLPAPSTLTASGSALLSWLRVPILMAGNVTLARIGS